MIAEENLEENPVERATLDAVAAEALGARRAQAVEWAVTPVLGGLGRLVR